MKQLQLFTYVLVFLFMSCQKENEKIEDKSKPSNNTNIDQLFANNIKIEDKLYFEAKLDNNIDLSSIEWTISSKNRIDNYSYTKVAGYLVNEKSHDFSKNKLLLLNAKQEGIKTGWYAVEFKLIDQNKKAIIKNFEFEYVNKLTEVENNTFVYDNNVFKISKLNYCVKNKGTDLENIQIQICTEKTSVSQNYLSKGSVIWINIKISENEFKSLGKKKFLLSEQDCSVYVYLNKDIKDKIYKEFKAETGFITLEKQKDSVQLKMLDFDFNTNENILKGNTNLSF